MTDKHLTPEEHADRDIKEGRYKEFDNVEDLIADLHGPETMKPCNNPTCVTCLCDCVWRITV